MRRSLLFRFGITSLARFGTLLLLVVAGCLTLLGPRGTSAAEGRAAGWSTGPSLPLSYHGDWDVSNAYFPPLQAVVLFGGSPKVEADHWNNQTWMLRNGTWQLGPAAPSGLTPRGGAAMAYHPGIEKIVLFGGQGDEWPPPNDTWLFDGSKWSPGPPAPPGLTGRVGARMVYDETTGKLVMFGGSGVLPYTETWLFDGTTWAAGPAAPLAMGPRVFFGMVYDPAVGKTYVAGGNGFTDGWYFDGASWTRGPSIDPLGPKERFDMAFDPQLGGPVVFGGIGPGSASDQLWVLRQGEWSIVGDWDSDAGWPVKRLDPVIVWHPVEDALMVAGGHDSVEGGKTERFDSWFFRHIVPQVESVAVTPVDADKEDALTLSVGPVTGGYGKIIHTYRWYVNGQLVAGAVEDKLTPGPYQNGDQVHADVVATDALGFSSEAVTSNVVAILNRPPSIKSVGLLPVAPYVTTTLTTTLTEVKDPDGDVVTPHYQWQVNGSPLAGVDTASLTPDHFTAGDTIMVTVTPVDSMGMSGSPVSSPSRMVGWNIQPNGDIVPGGTVGIKGGGYRASEQVHLKLDSPTAPTLKVITANSKGDLPFTPSIGIPAPLVGGQHTLYGVGQASGTVGQGPAKVIPTASVTPKSLAAGDATVFSGMGYVPGETVSVRFPGGAATPVVADVFGSVATSIVSPPQPYGGDEVTGTAPSGTAESAFTVVPVISIPASGAPKASVSITLTGFAAGEVVEVSFDGGPPKASFTADTKGSVSSTLVLDMFFGNNHDVKATGKTSKASDSAKIDLPASMSITPKTGPTGTTVTVTSGPGWVPGQAITIQFGGKSVKTVTTSAAGSVNTTFVTPTHKAGTVTIKLTESVLGLSPSATFTVK